MKKETPPLPQTLTKFYWYMKRLLIALSLLGTCFANAQEVKEELQTVQNQLERKQYSEALQRLKSVEEKISQMWMASLSSELLPTVMGGLKRLADDPDALYEMNPSVKQVTGVYRGAEPKSSGEESGNAEGGFMEMTPRVRVTITNDLNMASDVAMMHTGENPFSMEEGGMVFKPLRVKGYRATFRGDDGAMSGKVTVIVGGAVIDIEGQGFSSEKDYLKFANAIDFEKIIQNFGL